LTRGLSRALVVAIGALVLVTGLGAVGWRVLRPSASLDRAGTAYPVRAAPASAAWSGSLQHAPLIVDGRLRVYAEDRRVWADDTVTARYETTPYWSYRRWPAQLVGVVSVERPVPYVIARWSDGVVTGIDARAGRIAWQKRIAPPDRDGYQGRRTGARTVYDPPGLYTAADENLIIKDGNEATGYDPATGRRLWTGGRNLRLDRDATFAPAAEATGGRGTVLATDAGRVYLLTPDYRLVTRDAATGAELSAVRLGAGRPWRPGYVYVHDGFVVLERLVGSPRENDDGYYYSAQSSVLLAGTNPAPLPPRPGTDRSPLGYRP
jgi:hypothetical protein